MDREEIDKLIAEITARGEADAEAEYVGQADDGFQIARALLTVLGRRLGLPFVIDVQAVVLEHARDWSESDDPLRRADAVEIVAVANAGYFTDLIDELSEKLPSGRA